MNSHNGLATKLLHFIVFSNWWVACCLSGLALGFAKFHGISDAWMFTFFALCGTYFTYNFHRMVRIGNFQPDNLPPRLAWQFRHRRELLVTTILFGLAGIVTAFFLPISWKAMLALAIGGFIVLFYVVPVPLVNIRLRNLPGMKAILVSVVWTILLLVPELNRDKQIDWLLTFLVGVWIYVQIVPFDLRDLSYDPPALKTLPQLIGALNSRMLCTVLAVSFTIILTIHAGFHWTLLFAVAVSQIGLWWKQTKDNSVWLELLWDGNLLITGIYLYVIA